MAQDERSPVDGGKPDINFFREAFRSQYNWIGIAGVAAFALVSGSALPLLLGAGIELMYLSVVPHWSRFQRLVRSRNFAEEKRRIEASLARMVVTLPADMRARYEALQQVCSAIRANYARLSATSQIFARQMEDRLDNLLQSFLRLLATSQQHGEYLRGTTPDAIRREMAQLQKAIASDPPMVQEINKRRIEILQKRLEKFEKIRENHQVIDAQCSAIEDVLGLIRDQSVTMRDPQQVSDQLGSLVHDVEQTEETVREVEAIFETTAPELGISLAPAEPGASGAEASPEIRKPTRS